MSTEETAPQHSEVRWTLTKEEFKSLVVSNMEKIAARWKDTKPGELLADVPLADNIALKIKRSFDSLYFHIFLKNKKNDSAQVELRRMQDATWNIIDRQVVDKELKGKGILSAFMAGAEKFVESHAEQEQLAQCIRIDTGQSNVFQVFEHLGYMPRKEEIHLANFLRNPERHPEVIQQYHWVQNWDQNGMTEITNQDPYCFMKDELEGNPRPMKEEAIRVTLEKYIHPKAVKVAKLTEKTRDATDNLL